MFDHDSPAQVTLSSFSLSILLLILTLQTCFFCTNTRWKQSNPNAGPAMYNWTVMNFDTDMCLFPTALRVIIAHLPNKTNTVPMHDRAGLVIAFANRQWSSREVWIPDLRKDTEVEWSVIEAEAGSWGLGRG